MSDLIEQVQKLVDSDQGSIQKIYMGGSVFETWFIYTGNKPIKVGDQMLETDDMLDLSYWDCYE